MKLLRKLSAFILVFCLLSGTVAAMSAAVYVGDPSDEDAPLAEVGAVDDVADEAAQSSYTPRMTAPAYSNPYYYSDKNIYYRYGWGMPNCTCYAYGRAYEILGKEPKLCPYSAYLWYDYNLENRYYPCGKEPKLGAIACWTYTSGDSGHVAVVEKIANGKITFSNSAWGGDEFYTNTAPISDPSGGRKTWIFQGFIYICDYQNPDAGSNTGSETFAVEGDKPASGDVYCISDEDGVNLRSSAGTRSSVVGGIVCGENVVVTKTEKADGYTWGYTSYGGRDGWFALEFADLIYTASVQQTDTKPVPPAATEPDEDAPLRVPELADGCLRGDVDGDGDVTILDATRIQRVLAKLVQPTDYMLAAGDYDGDHTFSVMDATRIRIDLAGRRS